MYAFNSRDDGLSYDAILGALQKANPTETTRSLRNQAKLIAGRALEMPSEDRYDFVNRKVWEKTI